VNLHISPNEVLSLLIRRIQKAGLLSGLPRDHFVINSLEVSSALLTLLGHGWRHDCRADPVIYCPSAVIVPCDLSTLFNWNQTGNAQREFNLLPPQKEIVRAPYYLRDIRVYHRTNIHEADQLIQTGWHELNLLESAQLLAQSCANYHALPMERGFGGVTTRNIGIPVEGSNAALQLHVFFTAGRGLEARTPLGEPSSTLYGGEHNHHVAICREVVDQDHLQEVDLGTLVCSHERKA